MKLYKLGTESFRIKWEHMGDSIKRERMGDSIKREHMGDHIKREHMGDRIKREQKAVCPSHGRKSLKEAKSSQSKGT